MSLEENEVQEAPESQTMAEEATSEAPQDVEAKEAPQGEDKETKPKSLREALNEAVEKQEVKESQPEEETKEKVEEAPEVEAPRSMPKDLASKFNTLPKEWQDFYHKREQDIRVFVSQKGEELQQEINKARSINETLGTERDYLARRGIDPSIALQNSIAWDRAFSENPLGAARQYLESWNIHPADLLDEDGGVISDDYIAQQPKIPTAEDIDKMVQERVDKALEYQQQSWATQQKQKAVESFISATPVFKDPAIAAHFEPAMARVLAEKYQTKPSAPIADLLAEAYNETLSSPAFRGLKEQLESKETAERSRQSANKAKNASRSISGSLGSRSPKRKFNDLGENLRANWKGDL